MARRLGGARRRSQVEAKNRRRRRASGKRRRQAAAGERGLFLHTHTSRRSSTRAPLSQHIRPSLGARARDNHPPQCPIRYSLPSSQASKHPTLTRGDSEDKKLVPLSRHFFRRSRAALSQLSLLEHPRDGCAPGRGPGHWDPDTSWRPRDLDAGPPGARSRGRKARARCCCRRRAAASGPLAAAAASCCLPRPPSSSSRPHRHHHQQPRPGRPLRAAARPGRRG